MAAAKKNQPILAQSGVVNIDEIDARAAFRFLARSPDANEIERFGQGEIMFFSRKKMVELLEGGYQLSFSHLGGEIFNGMTDG